MTTALCRDFRPDFPPQCTSSAKGGQGPDVELSLRRYVSGRPGRGGGAPTRGALWAGCPVSSLAKFRLRHLEGKIGKHGVGESRSDPLLREGRLDDAVQTKSPR